MSLDRFFGWYPKYKKFKDNPTVKKIYEFLSEPESIDKMISACENGKPALSGIVQKLEEQFANDPYLTLSNNTVKQLIGSLIKEVLYDFGYIVNIQRVVSNSQVFSSATHYCKDDEKVKKILVRKLVIEDVSPLAPTEETLLEEEDAITE
ncbi:hypothetical protein H1S01_03235 [Heliobacterium chlorum]|uniref:Uncharacterized protein n=1 Tax=Heliobacterium chlorum TaxID=2698 RepID=A0ABR7SZU2_HELCL|nr:hypothetical protein [Heliobacterium chlorum]MBC9783525.1 hypothetical protein [Heliobacterium chlorum]